MDSKLRGKVEFHVLADGVGQLVCELAYEGEIPAEGVRFSPQMDRFLSLGSDMMIDLTGALFYDPQAVGVNGYLFGVTSGGLPVWIFDKLEPNQKVQLSYKVYHNSIRSQ